MSTGRSGTWCASRLSAGTHIEGEIAWDRRFDHMQQHTGQHLLSAVFLRELNAPTVSFHLGETTSTIDLAGTPLAQHSLERIERLVNELIAEDRAVSVRYVSRAEAESMLASGALRKLPDRSGDIRLIEIAGIENNACGGTHVHSTGQIGGMLLRGTEKVSRGMRVEFVCGLRAVRTARADAAILAKATASLSVGAPDIPGAIERLKTEAKSSAKERMDLREQLADYHAARLAVEVQIAGGLRLVDRAWKDRDAGYVKLLATRLTTAAPSSVAIFCSENSGTVSLFFARSLDLSFDCGRILKEALSPTRSARRWLRRSGPGRSAGRAGTGSAGFPRRGRARRNCEIRVMRDRMSRSALLVAAPRHSKIKNASRPVGL